MASELRLTTADRTLNDSFDPTEAVYAVLLAVRIPEVRQAINAARSCKVVFHLSGGTVVDGVDLSFTARQKIPISQPRPR